MPGLSLWLLPVVLIGCSACSQPRALAQKPVTGALTALERQRNYPSVPQRAAELAALLEELEVALRDSKTPEQKQAERGHKQQVIYRQLGRQPALAQQVRRLLSPQWRMVFDHHIGARQALQAMNPKGIKPTTLPAWRIRKPEPPERLLAYYRKAQQATGIAWEVLAAVNLVETGLGRIDGVSSANAQGPMQFLPTTWAERGIGKGDIRDPHDAIQAAARYLVRRGGLRDIRKGLWGYNNSAYYGKAVLHYAALLKADPEAFRGLYHWQIHLLTSAGDLWLPEGMAYSSRVPVTQHLSRYPWSTP